MGTAGWLMRPSDPGNRRRKVKRGRLRWFLAWQRPIPVPSGERFPPWQQDIRQRSATCQEQFGRGGGGFERAIAWRSGEVCALDRRRGMTNDQGRMTNE